MFLWIHADYKLDINQSWKQSSLYWYNRLPPDKSTNCNFLSPDFCLNVNFTLFLVTSKIHEKDFLTSVFFETFYYLQLLHVAPRFYIRFQHPVPLQNVDTTGSSCSVLIRRSLNLSTRWSRVDLHNKNINFTSNA